MASPPPAPQLSPDGRYYWDGHLWQPVKSEPPKWLMAVLILIIVGFVAAFMFLVTTFLFHFSGGQYRMGPVVNYGALAVIGGTLLLAAVAWRVRSPVAALKWTVIATLVAWFAAVLVEWYFSFFLGAG